MGMPMSHFEKFAVYRVTLIGVTLPSRKGPQFEKKISYPSTETQTKNNMLVSCLFSYLVGV